MRPEEYLALQWSDIDFKRGTAQIQRALIRHKKNVSFEEPKTARSRRTVYLSEQLMKKLATHKRKQAVKKLKFKGTWGPFPPTQMLTSKWTIWTKRKRKGRCSADYPESRSKSERGL